MIKKSLKYTFIFLASITTILALTKPDAQKVLAKYIKTAPPNAKVSLHSERDYFLFNAIQIKVQEQGNMFVPSSSYVLTYMGIAGQTIDLSDQFR